MGVVFLACLGLHQAAVPLRNAKQEDLVKLLRRAAQRDPEYKEFESKVQEEYVNHFTRLAKKDPFIGHVLKGIGNAAHAVVNGVGHIANGAVNAANGIVGAVAGTAHGKIDRGNAGTNVPLGPVYPGAYGGYYPGGYYHNGGFSGNVYTPQTFYRGQGQYHYGPGDAPEENAPEEDAPEENAPEEDTTPEEETPEGETH